MGLWDFYKETGLPFWFVVHALDIPGDSFG